ncbi:amino acid/polyamine/organocation transporter (APC superfamily) [Rarobacter faecitabidus]|uniref:Amino acid/polyamine/organocation transporter (APC superfamily) n=1 Tax=Rarobacter faecitabidus TaxID=13243 RepID=A0A542ZW32_RARFA|nr:amino acid/polyamine/organocation transporter (APC superfamily) [Rarobacter faecitabidus]
MVDGQWYYALHVPNLGAAVKRLIVGRPVRSDRAGGALLPKRLALPVFASDALSSVAYAPDEVLLTLAVAGGAATLISPWIGVAVAIVLATVVASYRQNVRAYPSGGGDYEVVTDNLGDKAGMTVASALLVDYVLTVAVSVSAGVLYAASAIPALRGHEAITAVGAILLLAVVNLRGLRESGRVLAIPVYLFMGAVALTGVVGFVRFATGTLPAVESANLEIIPSAGYEAGLVGLAGVLLVARAFASGAAALTGVEAVSNGVPAFKEPKSRNAATTLAILGGVAITMIVSILVLAHVTGVKYVENLDQLRSADGALPDGYVQHPVLVQLASASFSGVPVMLYVVSAATGLILFLAANTAFNGFPILGSILARDGYLPRQLHTRGDRLVLSNGIMILAAIAAILVFAFDASVTRLIQLYIVGVFVSFTLSQLSMVRHWTRKLATATDSSEKRRMQRSRLVGAFGFLLTSSVLVIVLVTKFTHGAWITLLLMAGTFALMRSISKHYATVGGEVRYEEDDPTVRSLPSRVHAMVLVARVHKPTMRAIAYARATRPSQIEAVTVAVDPSESAKLLRQWDDLSIPVPLRVLDSPFREITRPVLGYIKSIRRSSPRDLVVVFIPEYVVTHWWEQLLHNQSALRLKTRLLFVPGVVVASVPWQLGDSGHGDHTAPGNRTRPPQGRIGHE